jgi:hypothetical protein
VEDITLAILQHFNRTPAVSPFPACAIRAAVDQCARVVDVAGHQVPAQAVPHAQRALQIHAATSCEAPEIRTAERFASSVELEQIAAFLDQGQTATLDGDAVAYARIGADERRADDQVQGLAGFAGAAQEGLLHRTKFFHKPGEHSTMIGGTAPRWEGRYSCSLAAVS